MYAIKDEEMLGFFPNYVVLFYTFQNVCEFARKPMFGNKYINLQMYCSLPMNRPCLHLLHARNT